MLVLALSAVAVATATVAWVVDQRRCRRRNARGACGACNVAWAATPSGDPYLIHGRLVCEDCADKAKRRIPWWLGALAGWALVAAIATGNAVSGNGVAVVAFSVAVPAIVVPLGAVQLMKLANRRAQRRIAAGEFPDFEALGSEKSVERKRSLPEGPAG